MPRAGASSPSSRPWSTSTTRRPPSIPRRLPHLRERILERSQALGLARDLGIEPGDPAAEHLARLDNHLCEIKELQIRDGLHVFGRSPEGGPLTDLLVALARAPRGRGEGGDASLLRALAADLELDWDPLGATLGDPWAGPRPPALVGPRPVANPRRHRRAPGAAEPAAGRRRGRARSRLGGNPSGAATDRRAPAARRGILRHCRDRGPARGAGRSARPARPQRRTDPRPARGAADRPQLLLGRLPRRADAGSLAAGLALGRAGGRAVPAAPRHLARGRWRCPPGAPPTCAPAATTSRRPWRSSAAVRDGTPTAAG